VLVTSGRGTLGPVSIASPRSEPLGLLARHIAFVDLDLAAFAHIYIHAPALALGCLGELIAVEIFAGRDDHHVEPSGIQIVLLARVDYGVLRGPERVGICKIAVLAEQIGDDRKAARIDVEQGMFDLDRLPAEQPCLQLLAGRAIGVVIVVERQPCLLLLLARQRQMPDGRRVDLLLAVKIADARKQVTER
jgi:hypothetical protein